jgi:hypothetical protein
MRGDDRTRPTWLHGAALLALLTGLACGSASALDVLPSGNIRFDRIQGGAVGAKILLGSGESGDYNFYDYAGFVAAVEVGEYGGSAMLGISSTIIGEFPYVFSLSIGPSILRTWDDPKFVEPNQTYVGLTIEASVLWLQFSAGAYGHVYGNDDENEFIVTGGIGIGF